MKNDQFAPSPQQPSHDRVERPARRRPARRFSARRQVIAAAAVTATAAAVTAAVALPGAGSQQHAAAASRPHAAASRPHVTMAKLTRSASRTATGTATATDAPTATGAPTAAAPLPAGQHGTRQDVPWPQVGPGWILATRSQDGSGPSTLFLIDPAGGRYRLGMLPPQDYLYAWSGDGQRALLNGNRSYSHVAVLNLQTGKLAGFSLGSGVSPVGFTRPDGLAILADAGSGTHSRLERLSLAGALEQTYPVSFTGGGHFDGSSAVYSPDGAELAVSTSSAMELLSNDGQVIRALPVGPKAYGCTPVRWWSATELLARCSPTRSGTAQLWLVPVSGAPATALTASPAARGDAGDLDAWPLPSGTYVQDAGACGYVYLAKLRPNRQTAPVTVPGINGDSVFPLGSYTDELAIQTRTPCRAGSALLWYSAAHGTTTPLLGGAAPGGGTVGTAFLFGEPTDNGA